MKCLNCDREIDDNSKVCPFCDHVFSEEEKNMDMPLLKEDEEIVERTRAISPIHDGDLSLVDEINEEIEKNNKEKEVNVGNVNITEKDVNSILKSNDSLKKRKIILGACSILTVVAIVLSILLISARANIKENKGPSGDYMANYEKALNTYFETGNIDDVIVILRNNRSDEERVNNIQRKTRTACDSWLLNYINSKVDKKDTFEELTKKYEQSLDGLNKNAVVKVNDVEIKALTDTDYRELSDELNSVYTDSFAFFEALTHYDEKDYNKAYYMFGKIENTNTYYDKARYYQDKTVDNVLELLRNDINKLEKNIDSLTDDEKISRYSQVESIIVEYDSIYVELKLSKNDEYAKLLQECRDHIKEFNTKED